MSSDNICQYFNNKSVPIGTSLPLHCHGLRAATVCSLQDTNNIPLVSSSVCWRWVVNVIFATVCFCFCLHRQTAAVVSRRRFVATFASACCYDVPTAENKVVYILCYLTGDKRNFTVTPCFNKYPKQFGKRPHRRLFTTRRCESICPILKPI